MIMVAAWGLGIQMPPIITRPAFNAVLRFILRRGLVDPLIFQEIGKTSVEHFLAVDKSL
jgi:hypothetical protein